MMGINDGLFGEVWVSSNYTIVFCTENEKENYLNMLSSKKNIPQGMSVVLTKKKLNRLYTKNEIMNATPKQLQEMIDSHTA